MCITLLELCVVIVLVSCSSAEAFIFDIHNDDAASGLTLMNYKYEDSCLKNITIKNEVENFMEKYDKLNFDTNDVRLINEQGFERLPEICKIKRDIAKSMTDYIRPIAQQCVKGRRQKKEFEVNTLLIIKTAIDFVCEMNQTHFDDMFVWQITHCFIENSKALAECEKVSFDLYFWESVPEKGASLVLLLNGSICNFNYEKFQKCAKDAFTNKNCGLGAMELCSYLLNIIKHNSLCNESQQDKSEDTSADTDLTL